MTDDNIVTDDSGVTDLQRGWSIYRCPHGCMHVALGSVTVSLTGEEFDALLGLLMRARHQVASADRRPARPHTH